MSIRNILVAFDGSKPSERALRLAAQVAEKHDAHLSALHCAPIPASSAMVDFYLPPEAISDMEERVEKTAAEAEGRFNALVGEQDSSIRTDWFTARGLPNEVLAEYARTYDLLVIGQPTGEPGSAQFEPNPDVIALQSGRPVLVAPRGYEDMALKTHAVVAWDGRRAAARALADAMVFLDTEKVTVLHVGDDDRAVRAPGRDVMTWLSRHDIHAELNLQPRGVISIADIVLNACADSGAGLLVMGAYEHSRFSELFLGGVTREVVRQSHIPILMSH